MNIDQKLALIQARIDKLLSCRDRITVAIEGPCTSGKTTLAAALAQINDCNVIHMDDFFLRPEQRTPERYAEPGGNVDYERFEKEVLLPLQSGKEFSYRPFDCKTFALAQPVPITPKRLTVIEGSYSLHPYFGKPYDLKILLTVAPELQRERILNRPEFLQEQFFTRWIPMENRYLDTFGIQDQVDLVL